MKTELESTTTASPIYIVQDEYNWEEKRGIPESGRPMWVMVEHTRTLEKVQEWSETSEKNVDTDRT